MTAMIDLTVTPIRPVEPVVSQPCPLAPRADEDEWEGCQHPSGSCKPEGCSAC